eukprot:CAMPEP_0203948332 /NCGR_PEP_ID=MMETSP0359-20131031/83008_1 /ASSEMBLY_ACC=CAM_ASM_000338 /TAXON_ID=268821 /ORGANISM="Scrippsiella Hangoei, Strain SHTV-5" /LENGTH=73 /DNA_ID=CAMNT_0050879849 /DNA_START=47 /DNA_END=268 /DNA_ORIENTATION=+
MAPTAKRRETAWPTHLDAQQHAAGPTDQDVLAAACSGALSGGLLTNRLLRTILIATAVVVAQVDTLGRNGVES